jgi:RNA polymerase sigma-70 factor (ECF subfamily)
VGSPLPAVLPEPRPPADPNPGVSKPPESDGPSVPSFDELVERHKKRIYYTALDLTGNHHDAEDLSQEVFIKAYRALDAFRGEAKLSTWLYRICVNTYLNRRRKKAVRCMQLTDTLDRTHEGTGPESRPGERAERSQMQAHIDASLDALSPRERTAFVLKHYDGLKIKEVADAMDVASGTVKSLLYRATRKLRDELAFYRGDL